MVVTYYLIQIALWLITAYFFVYSFLSYLPTYLHVLCSSSCKANSCEAVLNLSRHKKVGAKHHTPFLHRSRPPARAPPTFKIVANKQCDQIGRFITLWATFQSPWQQLFCPKCQHIWGNFCKFVKIFHFTSKILIGELFFRHLATFWPVKSRQMSIYKNCCHTLWKVAQSSINCLIWSHCK